MMRIADVRLVANHICVVSGHPCVQAEDPERPPCTYRNCRIMQIAKEALERAVVMSYPPRSNN
jgi:hypothetical protein